MATLRKIRCTVAEITDHGDRVYTLRLQPEKSLPVFQAGQFLHLAIDEYDPSTFWPDSRAFSIASSPGERDKLEVVYSVVGTFTKRMEQEIKVGKTVWAKLPYGDFVIDPNEDLVLFAGGTGVTAFIAFLRNLGNCPSQSKIHLFYGARKESLLMYRDELSALTAAHPRFKTRFSVETPSEVQNDEIEVGRLSVERAWTQLANPLNLTYYLSGPPPMIKALAADLSKKGVSPQRIRIDAWD